MPGAGSLAKCQCCCVDRLCSRGENRGTAPQLDGAVRHETCRTAFSCPAQKAAAHIERRQTVKEPRSLCACGRKESPIIFFGDMCGEENTSQAASVEFVRRRRTNYARSRLQPPPCQKGILFDSLKKPPLRSERRLAIFLFGQLACGCTARRTSGSSDGSSSENTTAFAAQMPRRSGSVPKTNTGE